MSFFETTVHSYLYPYIDKIALKAGKHLARMIAKTDKCDYLFLKRSSEKQHIVKTCKLLMLLCSFAYVGLIVFLPLYCLVPLHYILKTKSNNDMLLINLFMGLSMAALSLTVQAMGSISHLTIVRIFDRHKMLSSLKEYEARLSVFKNVIIEYIAKVVARSLSLCFMLYVITHLPFEAAKHIVICFLICFLLASFIYFFSVTLVCTLAHIDDFGKTEKKTSEQKDSKTVPEAI